LWSVDKRYVALVHGPNRRNTSCPNLVPRKDLAE
jgi:hypothetical protein